MESLKIISNFFSRLKTSGKSGSDNSMIMFLSFSNIIGNIVTIIAGILVARWILPAELGLFNGFNIIVGYTILAQIGIPSGLSRELPFLIGTGDRQKAEEHASTAQSWQLGLSALSFLVFLLISIYYLTSKNYEYAAGFAATAALTVQSFYVTKYLKILYRTNRDFNKLSLIKLINSAFSLLSILLVFKYEFFGLCLRAVGLAIVDFLITWYWRPIKVRINWKKEVFSGLFKIGFPMYAVSNVYSLWPLLQKTIIIAFGGKELLGLFAIAIIVENAMKAIYTAINSVIYPTMSTEWGKGASVKQLISLSKKPVIITAILFAVAIPVGWVLIPIVIKFLLPNYTESIKAAQWMLIAGFFEIFSVYTIVFNVLKKQGPRLLVYLASVLIWLLSVYILYTLFGFELYIFPIAMALGFSGMIVANFLFLRKYWSLTVHTISSNK